METRLLRQCHLLSDVILSAWNVKKFTNFFKFVILVGKEWCFIIWLNTAYYTTNVFVINTQSSIYVNLLKWFEFWSQNMINNDQSTLLYCCEDVKSHRSGGDTVPLNSGQTRKHSCGNMFPTNVSLFAHLGKHCCWNKICFPGNKNVSQEI